MTDGNEADAGAVETTGSVEASGFDGSTGPDESTAATGPPEGPPDGFVRPRVALVGVGLLWFAAVAAVGALLAAVYGSRTSPAYLAVAVAAATLSAGAGYASLRTFGFA